MCSAKEKPENETMKEREGPVWENKKFSL